MAHLHKLYCRLALLNDAMTLLVTLAAAACQRPLTGPSGGGSVPVAAVTLSLASASLTAGQTVQLTATPKDANGNPLSGRVITWTSSAAAVAAVSGSGLVTGVAVGSATITATSEGQSGTAAFTVTNVPVAAVTVSPATAGVVVGQMVQLTATPKDANGNPLSGRVITWTSSAAAVAAVSGSGLVTGVVVGSATITATSEGQSGTAAVTVTSSAGAGGCSAPQPGWIWCDDFEQNRLASYYEYDNGGGNFGPVVGVGRNGGTAMRAHFNVGTVSPGSLHLAFGKTPRSYFKPVDAGTAVYRELYWRFYYKAQSPWTGGNPNKLTRALSFVDPANFNSVVYAQLWGYGTTNFLTLDPASGTDPAGNIVTTGWNDFAHMRWLGAKPGMTPLYDATHVGQWHCIETHAKLNDPGQSNGVFEYWLDGLLDAQETVLNWVGSYQTYGLNALFLEGYWNAGSPVAQDMLFDDYVVSTQRIGC